MLKKNVEIRSDRVGLSSFLREHPHRGGMIVHRKRRILYMKATKTAGTSILRKTLEPNLGGFIHAKDTPFRFRRWLKKIDDHELSRYFIFAIVRDPYDRFISMAGHFQMTVDELIKSYDDLIQKKYAQTHLAPQINYTHIGEQKFVDRILKFENLQADFARLLEDLSLPAWELPHANRSDRSKLPPRLTSSQADFVSRVYADDIAAYFYPEPDLESQD